MGGSSRGKEQVGKGERTKRKGEVKESEGECESRRIKVEFVAFSVDL